MSNLKIILINDLNLILKKLLYLLYSATYIMFILARLKNINYEKIILFNVDSGIGFGIMW